MGDGATSIKGKYDFTIYFQNMFINYKFKTRTYENLITNNGVNFFLNRLFDENYKIYSIAMGKGTTKPTKGDTTLEDKIFDFLDINYSITDNVITLQGETQGFNINGATEIGVYYINTEEVKLISRNIHDTLLVPDTSFIIAKYYYIISRSEYLNDFTLVTGKTNTYSTSLNYTPNSIIETDTKNGYHKLTEITNIDSTPGAYYYDSENNLLYIHCSDSANPGTHRILINY